MIRTALGFDDRDPRDQTPRDCSAHVLGLETALLRGASATAKADFVTLRCSVPLEHYEHVVTELASLEACWRGCRFRLYDSLADEFAHRLRGLAKNEPGFRIRHIAEFVEDIRNRVDGAMRRRLEGR